LPAAHFDSLKSGLRQIFFMKNLFLKVGLGILQITSAKRCPQVWPWVGRSLFSTDFVEFDQAV